MVQSDQHHPSDQHYPAFQLALLDLCYQLDQEQQNRGLLGQLDQKALCLQFVQSDPLLQSDLLGQYRLSGQLDQYFLLHPARPSGPHHLLDQLGL